jgi:hypothetical protein
MTHQDLALLLIIVPLGVGGLIGLALDMRNKYRKRKE